MRTNEGDFGEGAPWQMRAFALSPTSGRLEPVPLERTPDRALNGTTALVSYINANHQAILAGTHAEETPAQLRATSTLRRGAGGLH